MNTDKTNNLNFKGKFIVEQIRDGEVIDTWEADNAFMQEGRNYMLAGAFNSGAVSATWSLGLFAANVTPADTETALTFCSSGGTGQEFTSFDEGARPTWVSGAPAAGVISNSGNAGVFTISTGVTSTSIYGAFLVNVSTKDATTGVLMAAAQFNDTRVVQAADILNVTYTLNTTSS